MRKSIYILACVAAMLFASVAKAYDDVTISSLMSARIIGDKAYVTGHAGKNNLQKRVSLLVYDADKAENMSEAVKYLDYGYIGEDGNFSFEFDIDRLKTYKAIVNAGSNVYTDYLKDYAYIDDEIVFHDIFFNKVYPVEDGYTEATVYVESKKDYDEKIKLLMAVYKDSELVNTSIKECSVKKGYHATSVGNIYVPDKDCEIKAFVWKDKLIPLKNAATLEKDYNTAEPKSVHLQSLTTASYVKALHDGDYAGLVNIGLPCTISVELKDEEEICGLTIFASQRMFLKQYEISVSNNGVDYYPVSSGNMMPVEYISEEEGATLYFDEVTAKYVRAVIKTGFRSSAALTEVEVLKKNKNIENADFQNTRYENFRGNQKNSDEEICNEVLSELSESGGAIFFLGTNRVLTGSGQEMISADDIQRKVYKEESEIYIPTSVLKDKLGADYSEIYTPLSKLDSRFKYKVYNNEIILVQENEISVPDTYFESINRVYNPLKTTAELLMKHLNVRADDSAVRIDELYRREMYYHALEEFTYSLLNRLRKPDYRASFNVPQRNYAMKTADYLVGRITKQEYNEAMEKEGSTPIVDNWGVAGSVKNDVNADWTLGEGSGGYYALQFANNLVFAYLATKDNEYLQKYFMICDDFFENELSQINSIEPIDKQYEKRWTRGNTNYMHRAGVVVNTIANLARIAKSDILRKSGSNFFSTISQSLSPVSSDMKRDILRYTDFESVVKIYISLLTEYYPTLAHESKEEFVSNQLFEGVRALAYMSNTLTEYRYANELQFRADRAMLDFIDRNIHKDGGMLEQSFNYNTDTLANVRITYDLLSYKSEELKDKINSVANMFGAITKPTGDLPRIGNYNADIAVPEDWADEDAFDKWKSNVSNRFSTYGVQLKDPGTEIAAGIRDFLTGKSEKEPAFGSITFPYSGYTALRNGWNTDSSYMFMLAARPAIGHTTSGYNGIELGAFGKKMLVFGGPTWYGIDQAPDDQKDEYDLFQEYFAESSTYKANTVVIDGYNQAPPSRAKVAYDTTSGKSFFTSESFDYTEGEWEWGYKNPEGERIDDAAHRRQVFYVKDINAWIVEDTMKNKSDTETYNYSQMWGFNPEIDGEASGFSKDEIEISQNTVITKDTLGANLALYSFSKKNLSYNLYFGSKEGGKYRGWYAQLIAGERIPKPDVHIGFSGDPGEEACVSTLILPFENSNPLSESTELENGFSAVINGSEIIYQNKKNTTHEAFGINMTGDTLLCIKNEGKIKAIVLGCNGIEFCGSKIDASGNFEIIMNEAGAIESIRNISAPTDFNWIETDNGFVPEYK